MCLCGPPGRPSAQAAAAPASPVISKAELSRDELTAESFSGIVKSQDLQFRNRPAPGLPRTDTVTSAALVIAF